MNRRTRLEQTRETLHQPLTWSEAEIIALPEKHLKMPKVLVQRRVPDVSGPRGELLMYLPGQPCISLFTGAGGMDLGLEAAGMTTLCQVEWDESPCATLIVNRPRAFRYSALIQGDIREISTSMILREAGLRTGEAFVVCGGPPCQGFSTANSHASKGTYDTRNDLVFEFLRVVNEAKPAYFIMENVPGFLHFTGKVEGLEYAEMFCRRAYDCYYELVYGIINAVEYGVPQTRNRFICMGSRRDLVEIDGKLAHLPKPQNFNQSDLDLLAGTMFPEEHLITQAPGIRYFPDRPFLKPPAPTHANGRTETFLRFYGDLLREEPDRIVTVAA